jgi:Mitochondrial large subunit ribosomal protein (Img2)
MQRTTLFGLSVRMHSRFQATPYAIRPLFGVGAGVSPVRAYGEEASTFAQVDLSQLPEDPFFAPFELTYAPREVQQQLDSVVTPSGWTPALGPLPDLPFQVRRSTQRNLPIYTSYRKDGTRMSTILRRYTGDVQVGGVEWGGVSEREREGGREGGRDTD